MQGHDSLRGDSRPGCPVERDSTSWILKSNAAEHRSAGQSRAALPAWQHQSAPLINNFC